MFTPLVAKDFQVPEKLQTENFIIRKLCFSDAELDYKAVMSSVDIIKQTRGGDWPTRELSFLDDQIDLAWHQREFENKSSFTYTVISLDESECLGCLYLYQPCFRSDLSKGADVDVSFWVTQKAYDAGLYPVLYKTLDNWLKSFWPFKKIVYSNKEMPD